MSRDFELLQRAGMEQGIFSSLASSVASSVEEKPKRFHPISEEVHELANAVRRLFLTPTRSSTVRTVLFVGVGNGDGNSWICAGAAKSLASQVEKRVCVVDANHRHPSLHRHFGVENNRGFWDHVTDNSPLKSSCRQVADSNLWLLACGGSTLSHETLLHADSLRERVEELGQEFSYVLLDAPPVDNFGETEALGAFVDGVILVVGEMSTRRDMAQKAKEKLDGAGVRLLGAILNKRA